jgi:hypothetical protein
MAVCANAAGVVAAGVSHTVVDSSAAVITTMASGIFEIKGSFNLSETYFSRSYDMKDEQKSSTKTLIETLQKRK